MDKNVDLIPSEKDKKSCKTPPKPHGVRGPNPPPPGDSKVDSPPPWGAGVGPKPYTPLKSVFKLFGRMLGKMTQRNLPNFDENWPCYP